jgi:DNA (cytosine-5)-methyltransferase 1
VLTIGSLFDGISGFPLAVERAGGEAVWSAEIDPQCRNVAARHFPNMKSFDDVRKVQDATGIIRPSIVTAGWPCQGNSVAGKRAGMADPRSGLWGEVVRVLGEFRPQWFLGENVPGILSVNGGRDFGAVLRDLAELGYGFAYRILDAQWFGVPQRRRRVFIVGCLGNWRSAAEILFEREGLPWDSPPSRQTRARVADCLTAGVSAGSGVNRLGRRREDETNIVAACLNSGGNNGGFRSEPGEHLVAFAQNQRDEIRDLNGVAGAIAAEPGMKQQTYVAHTLRSEGHDASEDGTGRGVPLVAATLMEKDGRGVHTDMVNFVPQVLRDERGWCNDGRVSDKAWPLHAAKGQSEQQSVIVRSGVRRLTPRECERLQGYPDDWTRYGADGKEISDSARYRMLGNSIAVPCVQWIARRIIEATKANQ